MAHTCIPSSVTEMGTAVSSLPGKVLYSDALSIATTKNTNQLLMATLEEECALVGLVGVTYPSRWKSSRGFPPKERGTVYT